MTTIVPIGAAFIFLVATLVLALSIGSAQPRRWIVPAALSAVFAIFSIVTVFQEGPLGFWVEHTRNFWGNQIWLDLLLAAGVAWSMLVPKARSVGMRPIPWLALVVCTGSVGICAMLARALYLEDIS